uniref:Uncharacterized protein n=1 Tax=Siphoviridae sp. ctmYS12 TaxID=2825652 RepID=A0A8S5P6A5_9CAUD|nr:MAG TPA: hypothetical protein [Siphoviridae sp. ctmYS12]
MRLFQRRDNYSKRDAEETWRLSFSRNKHRLL